MNEDYRVAEQSTDVAALVQSAVERMCDVVYVFDLRSGKLIYLNPAAEVISGFGSDELRAMRMAGVNERIHPDDRQRYLDGIDVLMARVRRTGTGQSDTLEYRWQRKDGCYVWLGNSRTLLPGREGQPIALVGTLRDISAQKVAEQEREQLLAEVEQRAAELEAVFRALPDLYFLLASDGTILESRAGAVKDLYVSPEAFLGKHIRDVFPPEIAQRFLDALRTVLHTRSLVTLEYALPVSGRYASFEGRMLPLANEQVVMVVRNITQRKQAEQALRESELRLRDLNATLEQRVINRTARLRALALELTRAEERERRRLARLLHDHLQQFLAAARINVGMLRGRTEDDWQAQMLGQADELLGEAIDMSRSLTAQLSPPVLYDAGLAPALEWLARWIGGLHHLDVQVEAEDLGGQIPHEVRMILFQSARELLFNVVKHAGVDRARVEFRRLSEDEAELVVSDEGVGMDPVQIEGEATGGFGLFNIRERLEAMGGQVQIESSPGQGARVSLIVPLRPTEPEAIAREAVASEEQSTQERASVAQAATVGEPPVRVLLVDDHVIVRQGLALLLEEEPDIELVGQANDGQEAVVRARETHPDVVLMDVTMPIMDGIEATRRIMAELPEAKVIGLSMHEGAEMAGHMREAGAVDYVPKGGDPKTLVECVRQWAISPQMTGQ
jgi:PAS domain S-box-containing protein